MSNFKKSNLTKRVWYQNSLWKLAQVISPNESQDFLLLELETDLLNADCSQNVIMTVIDAHNDVFYPNTKRVQKLMVKNQRRKDKAEDEKEILNEIWMGLFKPFIL